VTYGGQSSSTLDNINMRHPRCLGKTSIQYNYEQPGILTIASLAVRDSKRILGAVEWNQGIAPEIYRACIEYAQVVTQGK
jgi:hypothetical protein